MTTRGLLGLVNNAGPLPESVLDVGSGIGALSLELLQAGVRQATCVDLSPASLAANAAEAERLGLADRVERVAADFVAVAATLPPADLVTLDRVVCCYPEYAPLLDHAAAHCRRLLAFSYPRDRWWVRLGILAENAWRRLRGDQFRAFLHSPDAMAALLLDRGFTRTGSATTLSWQIELHTRSTTPTP